MKSQIHSSVKETILDLDKGDLKKIASFLEEVSKLNVYTIDSKDSLEFIHNLINTDQQDAILEFISVFNVNLTINGIDETILNSITSSTNELFTGDNTEEFFGKDFKKMVVEDGKEHETKFHKVIILIRLYVTMFIKNINARRSE